MIKHIVFDLGRVVVKWDPKGVLERCGIESSQCLPLANALFSHPAWLEVDRGRLALTQAAVLSSGDLGLDLAKVQQIYHAVAPSLEPYQGMLIMIERLKNAGLSLYVLSNMGHESMAYLQSSGHFLHYFDGIIFSAECGLLKPEPEIYQKLLDQYQLRPEACLFIDDLKENVQAAQSLGFQGIVHEQEGQTWQQILKLLSHITLDEVSN